MSDLYAACYVCADPAVTWIDGCDPVCARHLDEEAHDRDSSVPVSTVDTDLSERDGGGGDPVREEPERAALLMERCTYCTAPARGGVDTLDGVPAHYCRQCGEHCQITRHVRRRRPSHGAELMRGWERTS